MFDCHLAVATGNPIFCLLGRGGGGTRLILILSLSFVTRRTGLRDVCRFVPHRHLLQHGGGVVIALFVGVSDVGPPVDDL